MPVNDTEIIKCYKVSNTDCGSYVVWDSLKGAVDEVMATLESMSDRERKEIDECGLDSVAKELTENALAALRIGEKTHLFNDYFTVEAISMYRHEFEALPEHAGC